MTNTELRQRIGNREIKFRGKRLDTGEWVYGHLISDNLIGDIEIPDYDSPSIGCGVEDNGCSDRYEGAEYGFSTAVEYVFQNVYEVDPKTVVQFTGLKDKQGKDIYEGHIVKDFIKLSDNKVVEDEIGIILYSECGYGMYVKKLHSTYCLDLDKNAHEVIGNIFENPELIEE